MSAITTRQLQTCTLIETAKPAQVSVTVTVTIHVLTAIEWLIDYDN